MPIHPVYDKFKGTRNQSTFILYYKGNFSSSYSRASSSRDRIVVSTLRCGRSNPGSNPGHGSGDFFFQFFRQFFKKCRNAQSVVQALFVPTINS